MVVKSLIRPLIAAGFFAFAQAAPAMIECHIAVPRQVKVGEPVPLLFDLLNHGKHRLWVLDWNTPLEGLLNNYMTIHGPDGELSYRGPMLKRAQPRVDRYRELPVGHRLHGEIDLALAYSFTKPGSYRIEFNGQLLDVIEPPAKPPRGNEAWQGRVVRCPAQTLEVTSG